METLRFDLPFESSTYLGPKPRYLQLCAWQLHDFFDFPQKTKTIWLVFTKKPTDTSYAYEIQSNSVYIKTKDGTERRVLWSSLAVWLRFNAPTGHCTLEYME